MNMNTAKNRSYWLSEDLWNAARKQGIAVVVTEDTYYNGTISAGTEGRIEGRSNAGFSGIIASVRLPDGRLAQISAGILQAL